MNAKIVTVWYDETSDASAPKWVVDTDSVKGGESQTLETFEHKPTSVATRSSAARQL